MRAPEPIFTFSSSLITARFSVVLARSIASKSERVAQ
jgi:hypothetical protein